MVRSKRNLTAQPTNGLCQTNNEEKRVFLREAVTPASQYSGKYNFLTAPALADSGDECCSILYKYPCPLIY